MFREDYPKLNSSLVNLSKLIMDKLNNLYSFDLEKYFNEHDFVESDEQV